MEYVSRINLKTATDDREGLIAMALDSDAQMLPIGWSCVYKEDGAKIITIKEYYEAVRAWTKQNHGRMSSVHNLFLDTKEIVLDKRFRRILLDM